MTSPQLRAASALVLAVPLVAGCDGPQNWLAGAGEQSLAVERLFWVLLCGAAVIWSLVMAIAAYATLTTPDNPKKTEAIARSMVRWGGVALPTVTLGALLTWGLVVFGQTTGRKAETVITVDAEQWWWRVSYGDGAVAANELLLPQGRPVELRLTADDVIHSFWIPAIGGKMDMIPGRTNALTLTAVKPGVWNGVCAEFCGGAHAQMLFRAIVLPPAEYDAEVARQARPADVAPEDPGLLVFRENGCGACHTIRGTPAQGEVGPDLTHLASRLSMAAGILPVTPDNLRAFVKRPESVKPGAKMPPYDDLTEGELDRLTAFLMELE